MTTTFTFGKTNNKKNNSFLFNNSSTNYSKIIDNGILADLMKKNSYLFKNYKDDYYDDILLNAKPTYEKNTSDIDKALKLLANYKKLKKSYTLPFKLNTTYTLTDGTPIIFYDDEIQIGFDVYKYNSFSDISFLNTLNNKTKNIIINIYNTSGIKDININIL